MKILVKFLFPQHMFCAFLMMALLISLVVPSSMPAVANLDLNDLVGAESRFGHGEIGHGYGGINHGYRGYGHGGYGHAYGHNHHHHGYNHHHGHRW